MSERPLSKGLKPVESVEMLNFAYWLVNKYPDIRSTRYLTDEVISQLTAEFEQDRPDMISDKKKAWVASVNDMKKGDRNYEQARKVLERTR